MVQDKYVIEKIYKTGREDTEGVASLKRMLITVVKHAIMGWFEGKMWHWTARGALVLDDSVLQDILLLTIMKEEDLNRGRYEALGRLAVALGNIALAEQIITELMETMGETKSDNAIVNIVINMPYETTASQVMGAFIDKGDYGRVLNIASAIGDEETSERLILQMFNQGRIFPNTEAARLIKAGLYNPALGKILVRQLINFDEGKEQYMEHVGLMAAALGDREAAERAFQYLKEGGNLDKLQAGKIASALGNLSDAEEMVLKVYRRNSITDHIDGERLYCDSLGDIIGSAAKQNVKSAERMWKQVTWSTVGFFAPMAAVRVLEII